MPILKKEVEFAKEVDDVLSLVIGIVKDAKAGKSAGEIATGSISKLVDALAGVDQMDDELKLNRLAAIQTVTHRVGELLDVVLPK